MRNRGNSTTYFSSAQAIIPMIPKPLRAIAYNSLADPGSIFGPFAPNINKGKNKRFQL